MNRIFILFLTLTTLSYANEGNKLIFTSLMFGGGNKNYHNDNFIEMKLSGNIFHNYYGFSIDFGLMYNTEEGEGLCYWHEPQKYHVIYKTFYTCPKIYLFWKYFALDLGIAILDQERGWCENILYYRGIFVGHIKVGILDKFYISAGKPENYIIAINSDLLSFGIGFKSLKPLSEIYVGTIGYDKYWGYEYKIDFALTTKITLKIEGSFHRILQARKLEQHEEVYNIRVGLSYILIQ